MTTQVSRIEIDLDQVEATLSALWRNAAPLLYRLAQMIEQIEKAPPVKGYEDFFILKGRHPLEARLLAAATFKIGRNSWEERHVELQLASVIGALANAQGKGSLAVSRLARKLASEMESEVAETVLRTAWVGAGLPGSSGALGDLVAAAMDRDRASCHQLVEIAQALRLTLRDPRGRVAGLASATHETLLGLWQGGAYTYDDATEEMTDAATLATRIALNEPGFDPRPARRRQKRKPDP